MFDEYEDFLVIMVFLAACAVFLCAPLANASARRRSPPSHRVFIPKAAECLDGYHVYGPDRRLITAWFSADNRPACLKLYNQTDDYARGIYATCGPETPESALVPIQPAVLPLTPEQEACRSGG